MSFEIAFEYYMARYSSYVMDDYLPRVVQWNKIGGNSLDVAQESLKKMKDKYEIFLKDELLDEMIPALEEENDILLMDGIVDSFFVALFLKSVEEELQLKRNFSDRGLGSWLKFLQTGEKARSGVQFTPMLSLLIFTSYVAASCEEAGLIFDFEEACERVLESNMSKYPLAVSIEQMEKESRYIKDRYGCTIVAATTEDTYKSFKDAIANGGRLVFTDGMGKVRKPSTFQDVDLTGTIDEGVTKMLKSKPALVEILKSFDDYKRKINA
jgi:hypothetical protein